MNFFDHLRSWFIKAANVFLNLALDAYDWPLVGNWLGNGFADLVDFASECAYALWKASQWYEDTIDLLSEILSWTTIKNLIRGFWPGIDDAIAWFSNAFSNVVAIIDAWWDTIQLDIPGWIADIKSWTISQLNTFRNTILALISDIETWTTTQINTLQATLLALISDIRNWTTTQINTLQATILALISDIETWTTTQINTVRSTILAIIGDLKSWTQTEINTIKDLLTAIIDWDALTRWVNDWWRDRLLDIDSLINSWFLAFTPFWEGWQEIRDSVLEFFTDPLKWLYDRVEDFMDRYW